MNLDDRLKIDETIANIVKTFPENDDDFIFFIRGKISKKEFSFCSKSLSGNFFLSLITLAINNKDIKNEIIQSYKYLTKNEN